MIKNKYRALAENGNASSWTKKRSEAINAIKQFNCVGLRANLQIEFPDGNRKEQFFPTQK